MQPERIGPYLVERELGRGGAGIVYLATDPTLDRQVAIKALPTEVAADPETLRRFEREAKTVAALNQRNITSIHGFETVGDTRYLILEYVEGESIDKTLESGPLSIADALDCARQVADGLEAAHEKGIVHRDLKPANLRRRADGVVKILDFGLAKAVGADGVSDDSLLNITSESAIVGTPAYLSPEQAQGRSVDRRTDIWGFGCTLFELLTGRKAFAAQTLADLLRRILEEEPDYGALPARTPQRVRELLQRCLMKDPRERLRDIGDARIELERALAERVWTGEVAVAARGRRPPASRLWGYAAAVVAGAAGYALWSSGAGSEVAAPRHLTLHASGERHENLTIARGNPAFRISPDGRTVAFLGEPDAGSGTRSRTRLYLRRLDGWDARAVEQSDNLTSFAFSPDSAWLCMVVPTSAERTAPLLVKVPVDGSAPPVALAPWTDAQVLWLNDGTIIGSVAPAGTLRRVAAAGGTPEDVSVEVDGVEPAYAFDLLRQLPGGRGVMISIPAYGAQGYELHLGILEAGAARARLLLRDAGAGAWHASGRLLFTRHDRLLAVACDLSHSRIDGDPVVVADGLRTTSPWQHAWYDVADDGTLVYQPGGVQGAGRRLALVTGDGQTSDWSADRLAFDESVNVSLDGRRLVVTRSGPGGLYEVWGSEFEPPGLRPIAVSTQSDCAFAVLSRTGDFVLFDRVGRDRPDGIFRMPFDGSSPPTLVQPREAGADMSVPMAIAPDDGSFLYWQEVAGRGSLWLQSLRGDDARRAPVLVAEVSANARSGSFSPDGLWLAYVADESGRQTACVRRFAAATLELGPPIPVPSSADRTPVCACWSKSRQSEAPELLLSYFRSGRRTDAVRLLAGDPVAFSQPQLRFDLEDHRPVWDDILPDGRILAILRGPQESTGDRLHVVTDWFAELATALRRLPR